MNERTITVMIGNASWRKVRKFVRDAESDFLKNGGKLEDFASALTEKTGITMTGFVGFSLPESTMTFITVKYS